MRTLLLIAAMALMAAAGGYGAYRLLEPSAAPTVNGDAAPALTFTDAEGHAHALADLRGKWVLLNFWASWCAPCMDEIPLLVDAQRRYAAKGLQILGPALDEADAVASAVQRMKINYPVMPDFNQADRAMQLLGNTQGALPYSVLISPKGRIVDAELGGFSRERLERFLTQYLGH